MELAATLGIGLTVGSALTWLVQRGHIKYLREELKIAHAQIAHAVIEDKALIPPRLEPIEPPKPLSKKLQDVVNEWEDAESRAVTEAKIRAWQGEGWGEKAILRQYGANAT